MALLRPNLSPQEAEQARVIMRRACQHENMIPARRSKLEAAIVVIDELEREWYRIHGGDYA